MNLIISPFEKKITTIHDNLNYAYLELAFVTKRGQETFTLIGNVYLAVAADL
jgi:hypothetical protein